MPSITGGPGPTISTSTTWLTHAIGLQNSPFSARPLIPATSEIDRIGNQIGYIIC